MTLLTWPNASLSFHRVWSRSKWAKSGRDVAGEDAGEDEDEKTAARREEQGDDEADAAATWRDATTPHLRDTIDAIARGRCWIWVFKL